MDEREKELEERIKKFDKALIHYLVTILLSAATSIFVTLAVTGRIP